MKPLLTKHGKNNYCPHFTDKDCQLPRQGHPDRQGSQAVGCTLLPDHNVLLAVREECHVSPSNLEACSGHSLFHIYFSVLAGSWQGSMPTMGSPSSCENWSQTNKNWAMSSNIYIVRGPRTFVCWTKVCPKQNTEFLSQGTDDPFTPTIFLVKVQSLELWEQFWLMLTCFQTLNCLSVRPLSFTQIKIPARLMKCTIGCWSIESHHSLLVPSRTPRFMLPSC